MRWLRPRSTRFMQRQSRMGHGRQKARVGFARRRIGLNRKAAAFANAIARKWCHSRMHTVSTLDLNPLRRWRTPTPYHFSASCVVHRYVLSRSRVEIGWAHVVRPTFQGLAPVSDRSQSHQAWPVAPKHTLHSWVDLRSRLMPSIRVPGRLPARAGASWRLSAAAVGSAPASWPTLAIGRTALSLARTGGAILIPRRSLRAENRLSPIAWEAARQGSLQAAAPESSLDKVLTPRPPIRPKLQRASFEATLSEVEKNITARVEKKLDRRVSEVVEKTLSIDSVYSRKMSDAFFTALYDRMVLEKERLG
jgi:hypothetical protein